MKTPGISVRGQRGNSDLLAPVPGLLRRRGAHVWLALALTAWLGASTWAASELQFDVFVGYGSGGGNDGYVREAGWFPVACEIYHDGPTFTGTIEFTSRQLGGGQSRRITLELPTGTRKRLVFPVFAPASRFATWDARLLDARGRVRAEHTDLRCRSVGWETCLLGALPRSFGGLPIFPGSRTGPSDAGPQVAYLKPELFPDNPIALEGLTALYLNSEKALDLKANQVAALLAWVHGGGHLIVAPEQAQDISSTPWLRALYPCTLGTLMTNRPQGVLQAWLAGGPLLRANETTTASFPGPTSPGFVPQPRFGPRPMRLQTGNPYTQIELDPAFAAAAVPMFNSELRDGEVVLAAEGVPLVVTAPRGRGQITALAFSPEREPFRSWKNRAWFWARLLQVPGTALEPGAPSLYGGWSVDGVFGAMVDSRQVRKLPVEWLLALLVVYLVVIGPLDQWWLKRINRQMLTWLTFPAYVVLFSLLIYYIGYKLRAGETEWNQVDVVDILPRNEQVELRGRSYASLYSSVNARYRLGSDQTYATMRGEFVGFYGGGDDTSRSQIDLQANNFRAEISVPVWTSQLYVSDWEQPSATPLAARATVQGGVTRVTVENRLARALTSLHLAYQGRIYDLGDLGANQTKSFIVNPNEGMALADFVSATAQRFQMAASARRQVFGRGQAGRLELAPKNLIAASFLRQIATLYGGQRGFIYPAGLDLSPLVARGDAVVLAWDAGHSLPSSPFRRFTPPRVSENTLLRLDVPVKRSS